MSENIIQKQNQRHTLILLHIPLNMNGIVNMIALNLPTQAPILCAVLIHKGACKTTPSHETPYIVFGMPVIEYFFRIYMFDMTMCIYAYTYLT